MRFSATGDALITRRVTRWGGAAYDGLLRATGDADARFTNLETSLTSGKGYPQAGWGGTYLASPAGCLTDLVEMGFNLFSRANNHAGDWGAEGVLETTRVCDTAGVCHAGAGRFKQGETFGETWEPHKSDVEDVLRHVRDARRQADVVLMSFHGHEMGGGDPDGVPSFHREFCRACIDAGCDAVIGHGPHRLRGIEVHGGKPIFYSLGNFIFQNEEAASLPADFYERMSLDPITSTPADGFDQRNRRGKGGFASDRAYWESVVAWWETGDGGLREIRLYPVGLGHGRPRPQRGRPVMAEGQPAQGIIARMDGLCRPFGTQVNWDPHGYGILRW